MYLSEWTGFLGHICHLWYLHQDDDGVGDYGDGDNDDDDVMVMMMMMMMMIYMNLWRRNNAKTLLFSPLQQRDLKCHKVT